MFQNYISTNFKAINMKNTNLEESIYDYMYNNFKCHHGVIDSLNLEFNFGLLNCILNNQRLMERMKKTLFVIMDPINDYYSNLEKLDYYDLCLALVSASNFEFLEEYKEDIINILFDNFKALEYYLLNDIYGVGAFCHLINSEDLNKLQFQKLDKLRCCIKEKIFKMLQSESNEEVIAIYNLSIAKDVIMTNLHEKGIIISFILNNQNNDGSWGGPKAFFSSFALDVLLYFSNTNENLQLNSEKLNNSIKKGLDYIIYSDDYIAYLNTIITVSGFLNQIIRGVDN